MLPAVLARVISLAVADNVVSLSNNRRRGGFQHNPVKMTLQSGQDRKPEPEAETPRVEV
jgi:hypothetical protein